MGAGGGALRQGGGLTRGISPLRRARAALLCVATVLVFPGCSSDGSADQPQPDMCGVSSPPSFSDLVCEGDCTEMVISRVIFPDASTATQFAWDFNGDGTPDNALGSIAGAFTGTCGYGATHRADQEVADWPVTSGRLLHLLRFKVKPDSLAAKGPAQAQVWIAESRDCCPQGTPYFCQSTADQICFSGSSPHRIDPTVPGSPPMDGTVDHGKLLLGPGRMLLRLPSLCSVTRHVDLSLEHARITGQWTDGAITEGVITGVISQSDISCKVVPVLAEALNDALQSPSGLYKDTVAAFFDANRDGTIDVDELAENSIIKTFLAGDVDADQDGENELSFGVGFEAVGAVIVSPGAADAGPDGARDASVDGQDAQVALDHGE